MSLWAKFAVVVGAFAVSTAIAELLGADNLGIAIGFGQIGTALAVMFLLLRY